jgi:hypothetical protein
LGSTLRAALHAYVFGLVGVFLLAAPWSPLWENVALALSPTDWAGIARAGWLRGLVSGLGALNLWIALGAGADLWRIVRGARAAPDAE